MIKRIVAIVFIYLCTVVAWVVLGTTVIVRTESQDKELRGAVGQLWGTEQKQTVPEVVYLSKKGNRENKIPLDASDVAVNLNLQHRKKGLLWYSTYGVEFSGSYRVTNYSEKRREIQFDFKLPAKRADYDDIRIAVGDEETEILEMDSRTLSKKFRLKSGQSEIIQVSYGSQGLDRWWYDFGDDISQIRNFSLTMDTDFAKIDFPQGSMSPTEKVQTANGWRLTWKYASLVTGRKIGMVMPEKLNPGPWVSRVTLTAPVSLFLFFFLLFLLTTVKQVKIHPINYFFVAAAFFSFHLLLAYLVDHVSIHIAFVICSAVSIFLVASYMRLVVGSRFAFLEIGISQFVYLVLFSYTFFFRGYTGLAVTILCIVTLFIVMQLTARVDWESTFKRNGRIETLEEVDA